MFLLLCFVYTVYCDFSCIHNFYINIKRINIYILCVKWKDVNFEVDSNLCTYIFYFYNKDNFYYIVFLYNKYLNENAFPYYSYNIINLCTIINPTIIMDNLGEGVWNNCNNYNNKELWCSGKTLQLVICKRRKLCRIAILSYFYSAWKKYLLIILDLIKKSNIYF